MSWEGSTNASSGVGSSLPSSIHDILERFCGKKYRLAEFPRYWEHHSGNIPKYTRVRDAHLIRGVTGCMVFLRFVLALHAKLLNSRGSTLPMGEPQSCTCPCCTPHLFDLKRRLLSPAGILQQLGTKRRSGRPNRWTKNANETRRLRRRSSSGRATGGVTSRWRSGRKNPTRPQRL